MCGLGVGFLEDGLRHTSYTPEFMVMTLGIRFHGQST